MILNILSNVSDNEFLIIGSDLISPVGIDSNGFEGMHCEHGYGARNDERIRILDLCMATDLLIFRTC